MEKENGKGLLISLTSQLPLAGGGGGGGGGGEEGLAAELEKKAFQNKRHNRADQLIFWVYSFI